MIGYDDYGRHDGGLDEQLPLLAGIVIPHEHYQSSLLVLLRSVTYGDFHKCLRRLC